MTEDNRQKDTLVVSLEGHEVLQGRVDAAVYYRHISRLIEVLGSMERAFLGASKRKTRYLIADQKRINPYIAELVPNSIEQGYIPSPAQHWAAEQMHIIRAGGTPDERISAALLQEMANLPPSGSELVRNFKINGFIEQLNFDQQFRDNALMRAAERRSFESESFFAGKVLGEVRGTLLKIDALDGDVAVIVPDIGTTTVRCMYPEIIRHEIGRFFDRRVIARGIITYSNVSPLPESISIEDGGLEEIPNYGGDSLLNLEGIFEGSYNKRERRGYFG